MLQYSLRQLLMRIKMNIILEKGSYKDKSNREYFNMNVGIL